MTADGITYPLDPFFTVFSTENPLEFEGTYPLPEAQLDRFLMKIRVDYPTLAEERSILQRHHAATGQAFATEIEVEPVTVAMLHAARVEVRRVQVEDALFDYLLAVVRRTRDGSLLGWSLTRRALWLLLGGMA